MSRGKTHSLCFCVASVADKRPQLLPSGTSLQHVQCHFWWRSKKCLRGLPWAGHAVAVQQTQSLRYFCFVCVCVCVIRYIFICILFSLGVWCVCVCVCVCVYLSIYVCIYLYVLGPCRARGACAGVCHVCVCVCLLLQYLWKSCSRGGIGVSVCVF